MKRRLSAASILLGLALLSVVADGMCTLAGLRPMTMAISGALPDAGADPMLVLAVGALCAACRLAVLLFAPAFVVAAALLMVARRRQSGRQRKSIDTSRRAVALTSAHVARQTSRWILTRAERRPSGRAATSSR